MSLSRRKGGAREAETSAQREAANREGLAEGMRILLAEALTATLDAARESAYEVRCTPEAVQLAAKGLESAAYEAVRAGPRPAGPPSIPANYAEAVSTLRRRLGEQIGPYPDSIAGLVLLRGEETAARVAAALWAWEPPEPREAIRRMLLRTLLLTPAFAADRELALSHATKIEQGCYNAAVRTSKGAENPPRRQWDSEGFVSIYSDRCGAINGLLDPGTEANRVYAAEVVPRLLSGELRPEALGAMSVRELCPKATEAEREEIATRQSQKVVIKESVLFMCPFCKERRCEYETVQRRGPDEAPDYLCRCLACSRKFNGRF